ncbi:MAG: ABC-F family ATP-binding cassette domain-containing protein [Candidatus Nanopelagicales bacterium]
MSHPNSSRTPAVVLDRVSFSWPDGTPVLRDTSVAFGPGRTGVVGANGAGKSTLLRLVGGRLRPQAGSVTTHGEVGYLPQQVTLATDATVADLLGVRAVLDALRAIERGEVSEAVFEAVGDAWDVEARSAAVLDAIGLSAIGLDRPVGTLSGGETVLTALAGLRLAGFPVVLLDEPTNNLDRPSRRRLREQLESWRGALLVVSHDRALLDLMDDTAEVRDEAVSVFGGGFTAFTEHVEQEDAAARQALRTAEQALRAERRQRIAAETAIARRERAGRTARENREAPPIIMNQRKSNAQAAAGRLRGTLDGRVEAARRAVDEQAARVREDDGIRVDLPDPQVPSGRRLAELHDGERVVVLQGPERVALVGRNGIGKTRLLEQLVGRLDRGTRHAADHDVSAVALTERIGYLPQRLDHLADEQSVLDAVRAAAPGAAVGEVRSRLARFGLRGADVERPVGTLSGGERFRVALARLLLADPPSQLLVLDEPTNSLDRSSVDALVNALSGYRGAMLVVSHDDELLSRLAVDRWLELDEDGLRER